MPEREALGSWLTEPVCCFLFSLSMWFIVMLLIIMVSRKATDKVEHVISEIERMGK